AHLWNRAICFVANARDSYGYHCALRLASHADPQRPLSARLDQRVPRAQDKELRPTRPEFFFGLCDGMESSKNVRPFVIAISPIKHK
ncbi:MAG: hypothetical protein WCX93_04750, partial [Burkholderiaceae bacterium]